MWLDHERCANCINLTMICGICKQPIADNDEFEVDGILVGLCCIEDYDYAE